MAKHACRVVEGTLCNSSKQLSLKIEVFFGLEMIFNFDNVEPRFRLEGVGCIRCGLIRFVDYNELSTHVLLSSKSSAFVQLPKRHIQIISSTAVGISEMPMTMTSI